MKNIVFMISSITNGSQCLFNIHFLSLIISTNMCLLSLSKKAQ
jgi:hypothetical protein